MTTIKVYITVEEKEKLTEWLDMMDMNVDELVNQFMKWIVDYPEEAAEWFKKQMKGIEK